MTKAVEKHARAVCCPHGCIADRHPMTGKPCGKCCWKDYKAEALACLRVELEAEPTEAEVDGVGDLIIDRFRMGSFFTKDEIRSILKAARKARLREITNQGDGNG